jgi:hypothetical protein
VAPSPPRRDSTPGGHGKKKRVVPADKPRGASARAGRGSKAAPSRGRDSGNGRAATGGRDPSGRPKATGGIVRSGRPRQETPPGGVGRPSRARRDESAPAGPGRPVRARRDENTAGGVSRPVRARRDENTAGGVSRPVRARRDESAAGGVSRPVRARRDENTAGGVSRPARARRDENTSGGVSRPARARGASPAGGVARPVRRAGPTPTSAQTKKWGSVARRGARVLGQAPGEGPSASEVWRDAVARAGGPNPGAAAGEPWVPDEIWVADPGPDEAPSRASNRDNGASRGPRYRDLATGKDGVATPGGSRRRVPRPVVDELAAAAGPDRGSKLASRIADATYAYERDRYQDARRILRSLADEVPSSAAVRELYGLVLYRTGQWAQASRQLEAYRQLSRSYDQHPVLADCYRALRRYDDAEAIWAELREASPSGDLIAEGRIVAAGARADQGDLSGAIDLLERGRRRVSNPQRRHVRQWYALADLHERAGDLPRARELFARVAAADPEAFDVRQRLQSLR